jgi:ribonucleoside-diphosphate reductase beta chain
LPTPIRALALDPGFNLTLRPMRYPQFYDMYRDAIRNTWTVEEVNFGDDVRPEQSLLPAERHLINRLVAFFATGDSIVSNNLVLNLYKHINALRRECSCRASSTKRRCTSSSI